MDIELKQKWVEALRSGKYIQGKGMLRTEDDKFCCLGVLCDVADPTQWNFGKFKDSYKNKLYGYKDQRASLPHELLVEFNLNEIIIIDPNTDDGFSSKESHLINMNDNDEVPFPKIANWIEENV